ncbi:hypothetical protein [Collimonas humicola]|uniref:hypothetical protein n=1 Tax=Collimonas humicola TaxID=2825886 RepID=UPI001B8AD536|nr:hypothetical protein [Collimonas humicola]
MRFVFLNLITGHPPLPLFAVAQYRADYFISQLFELVNIHYGNNLPLLAWQCQQPMLRPWNSAAANDKKPPGANLAAFRYSESVD